MSNYPPITLNAVNALEEIVTQHVKQGKSYLKEAPYSMEIKVKLELILATVFVRNAADEAQSEESQSTPRNLTEEVNEIYRNLKNFKVGEEGSLSASEQIQLLKLQTTLLERLLEARERATGADQFVKFRETILDFVAAHFDADQINELKETINNL